MPILPDSAVFGQPQPVTGRRHYAGHNTATEAERPLMASRTRAAFIPDLVGPPTGVARVPPALTEASVDTHRKQFPNLLNVESGRIMDPTASPRPTGKAAVRDPVTGVPLSSFRGGSAESAAEGDTLGAYGHLKRLGSGPHEDAVLIGSLRAGVGLNTLGDKPYRLPEQSARFHEAGGKPTRWHADPAGPPPKLAMVTVKMGTTGTGTSGRSARPLWER